MDNSINRLLDISLLIAQELDEFVEEAKRCSNDGNAMEDTQQLLSDWKTAYKATGLTEDDHFQWARPKKIDAQMKSSALINSSPAINLLTIEAMKNLGNAIERILVALTGEKLAFFITVFSNSNTELTGRYISNANRNQVVAEVERLLIRLKSNNNSHNLH